MIAANKRFLKANLTQGVLGIQTNLINLYSNNLSAVATQAALIGGFSFSAVSALSNTDSVKQLALSYFYYVCFTVCLVAALFVLSQATIVVMFGPTMALKGSTDEAVKIAAGHMMTQQFLIFQVASVSITSLFLGACILSWANYPIGIATITTVIYLVGYYYVIVMGFKAYNTFVSGEHGAFIEPESVDSNGNITSGGSGEDPLSVEHKSNLTCAFQATAPCPELMECRAMRRRSCSQRRRFASVLSLLRPRNLSSFVDRMCGRS